MTKNYWINNDQKTIVANIPELTPEEEAVISKFVKYGYTVIFGKKVKVKSETTVKRLDEEFILEYLKDDPDAIKTYEAKKEEVAVDENGNVKTRKNGKAKKRGFSFARDWFMRIYPLDVSEALAPIRSAGMEKDLQKHYKDYLKKKKKNETEAMTADEYTKYYYWKRIFVNPNQD